MKKIHLRKMTFLPLLNRWGYVLEMGRVTYSVSAPRMRTLTPPFKFIKMIGSLIVMRDVEDTTSQKHFPNSEDKITGVVQGIDFVGANSVTVYDVTPKGKK